MWPALLLLGVYSKHDKATPSETLHTQVCRSTVLKSGAMEPTMWFMDTLHLFNHQDEVLSFSGKCMLLESTTLDGLNSPKKTHLKCFLSFVSPRFLSRYKNLMCKDLKIEWNYAGSKGTDEGWEREEDSGIHGLGFCSKHTFYFLHKMALCNPVK